MPLVVRRRICRGDPSGIVVAGGHTKFRAFVQPVFPPSAVREGPCDSERRAVHFIQRFDAPSTMGSGAALQNAPVDELRESANRLEPFELKGSFFFFLLHLFKKSKKSAPPEGDAPETVSKTVTTPDGKRGQLVLLTERTESDLSH